MSSSLALTARRLLGAALATVAVLALLLVGMVPVVDAQNKSAPLPAVRLSGDGPSVSATAALTQCTPAAEQLDRSTTFAGQMVAITLTQRMMMRIDVQERSPGEESFHTVSAPGLGVWRSSETGVKVYKYFKQVTNLPAPEVFRGVITFRWIAAKGHLLRQTVRHTQTCQQPDERPELIVGQVPVQFSPGSSAATYQVTVRNDGRGDAGEFNVVLGVNGVAQPPITVTSLAAGASTLLIASAPPCAADSLIEVQLDPQHHIEEAPGGGLPGRAQCPLGVA